MTSGRPWGVRLALWWAGVYTRTAPAQDARDRRAEVAADVADEVRAAEVESWAISRRIAGRVLRGMGSDVLWRLSVERSPGRARWHLDHPATLLGTLAVLLFPVVVLGDRLRAAAAVRPGWALNLVHSAEVLLSAMILAIAAAALLRRIVDRPVVAAVARRTLVHSVRRSAGLLACVCWAAAALWRFVPGSLGGLAGAAWAAFGLSLVVWAATAVWGWGRRRGERRTS